MGLPATGYRRPAAPGDRRQIRMSVMSERTAPSLAQIDILLTALHALPASKERDAVLEQAEALQRAVAAFHMEAIRFRIYSVEREVRGFKSADLDQKYDAVRAALEAAGFHTRSHAAPGA